MYVEKLDGGAAMVKIEDTVTGKKYGLYELGAVTCPDEKSSEKEEIFTFSQL